MTVAPLPQNESARLAALADYLILDTASEAIFDCITALASKVCDAPISLITFIDQDRQWFKSTYGTPPEIRQTSRDIANCAHTILSTDLTEITDMTKDLRFSDNPLNKEYNLKFYAGVPLAVDGDLNIGTLCILDTKPKKLTEEQKDFLKNLSQIIVSFLIAKKGMSQITLLGQMLESSFNEIYIFDIPDLQCTYANQGALTSLQFTLDEIKDKNLYALLNSYKKIEIDDFLKLLTTQQKPYIVAENTFVRKDNSSYPVEMRIQLTAAQSKPGVIVIANEITLRKEAEKKLIALNETLETRVQDRTNEVKNSLALIKATLQSTTDAILVINNENIVIDHNFKYSQINLKQKINPKSGLNIIFSLLIDKESFQNKLLVLQQASELDSFDELHFTDKRIFEAYSQPQIVNNKITGRVWCFRDVTSERNMQSELIHRATHDSLTNVPNRLLLEDRLNQAIVQADKTETIIAFLMIDIDRFKSINDSYGHQEGDLLLKEISLRIKAVIRPHDTVARLGGDEFIVLLTLINDKDEISKLVNNIQIAIAKNYNCKNKIINISSSIGISIYPKDTSNPSTLMKNADVAMYHSKQYRNNLFQYFSAEMHQCVIKRIEVEKNLKEALGNDELSLNYQPILNLKTGKVSGAEALIRWRHPILGMVPPVEFIPIAETSGTILPIGEWILKEACQKLLLWHDQGYNNLKIAINISAEQFKQENFAIVLTNLVQELSLNPANINLEITESIMLYNIKDAITKMLAIRELGFNFSIDDFGTGYSSLSYLKHLPICKIKIDQSFIKSIQSDPRDGAIIIAIISMAKSLGLSVIAEGVETQAQLKFLYDHGCDEIQGFYFSRPLGPL
jgi:diguanylate cyclase (GGDEF)-like protein/PAS domain S-box-containing protein